MNLFKVKKEISEVRFRALFDELYDDLSNYLYYKAGDMDLAEDIAQECFLTLWEKRAKVEENGAKFFLYRIAGNKIINHFNHKKVQLKFQSMDWDNKSIETPEYEMELKEFHEKLENAISNLPEKNRTVYLMNRIDKLTYGEISERVGISVKGVERRMSLAMKELKEKIGRKI